MNYINDIVINIIGNVIFWLALGLLVYFLGVGKSRRRFLRFFGLQNQKKMVVYLSNLWLPDLEKEPWGRIISGHEFRAIKTLNNLFSSASSSMPDLVRGLVDSFWIRDIDLSVEVSPLDDKFSFGNSIIVVGTTIKNSVRRYFLEKNMVCVRIVGETTEPPDDILINPLDQSFEVLKGKDRGRIFKEEGTYNLAVIEKLCNDGEIVIMCTGLHGDSSWAATEYLNLHWRELERIFRDKNFARCLWFRETPPRMTVYEEPQRTRDIQVWVCHIADLLWV